MHDILSSLGAGLLHVVLPSLGTILAAMLVAFLQKKAAQAGIELTQAQTDLLKTTVTHAVQAVEEKANRAASAGTPMTPEEKRASALAIVAGSPALVHGDIQGMIDTVLPEVRARLDSTLARIA